MNKNCIILHGSSDDPNDLTYNQHWIPWAKEKLQNHGITTQTPTVPSPWKPDYKEYKSEIEKYSIHEGTILIGHSDGATFFVHWLGETKAIIDTLILVSPWKIAEKGNATEEAFYDFSIDPSIRDRVNRIVIFTADDEEPEGKQSVAMFQAVLGGTVIELKNHGHFVLEHMGTEKFPELINQIVA